jgi:hypothetical protein
MIAPPPPYSAGTPTVREGILARTTLGFRIIFDGADAMSRPPSLKAISMPPEF